MGELWGITVGKACPPRWARLCCCCCIKMALAVWVFIIGFRGIIFDRYCSYDLVCNLWISKLEIIEFSKQTIANFSSNVIWIHHKANQKSINIWGLNLTGLCCKVWWSKMSCVSRLVQFVPGGSDENILDHADLTSSYFMWNFCRVWSSHDWHCQNMAKVNLI